MPKCQDESGCNEQACWLDGSASVCEDHTMSDTPIPLYGSQHWFMTWSELSKFGEATKSTALENRHPFEHIKVMCDRNDDSTVRVNYTLLSFQPISLEEYELAEEVECGLY